MTEADEREGTPDPWAWAREPDDDVAPVSPRATADWSWAHREADPRVAGIQPGQVDVVLVVHQAENWLGRTMGALAALEARPGRVVAIDTGSRDGSLERLRQAREEGVVDDVIAAGELPSFGAAVDRAIEAAALTGEWLWLLHDDLEPHPDALDELLLRASEADKPDLLFPALLQPRRRNHPDQLAEVGSSVTPGATRYLGLSPGEIDQRQVSSAPVLGGSTAGLLVRRAVWDELGGLDPQLPLFRDGQDLGWRANNAGHRVVTAPEARCHHRQEGRFGDRDSALVGNAATTDRLLGARLLAARAEHPGRALAMHRTRALTRGVGFLVGKAPGEAMAEFRAAGRMGAQRHAVEQMLARSAGSGSAQSVRPLLPTTSQRWLARLDHLQHAARQNRLEDHPTGATYPGATSVGSTSLGGTSVDANADSDTGFDDLLGDEFSGGRRRSRGVTPGRVLALLGILVTVVGSRGLWGSGRLTSAGLTPAPATLAEAWRAWLEPVAGEPGANPGWLGIMALGSTLTAGRPELFVRLLVIGAPLVGGLLAYRLIRRYLGSSWLAMALALVWPSIVLLNGVTARGSISGAFATILLPLVAWAALSWFDVARSSPGTAEGLRPPAILALCLGLLAQAAPVYALVGLVLAVVHWLLARRLEAGTLVAGLGPLLTLVPWAPRWWHHPGRLLTGTDPTAATPLTPPAPWQVLIGRGEPEGLPPLGISIAGCAALVLIVALGTVVGRRRLPLAVVAGVVGGAGGCLAIAAWTTRLLVEIDGAPVRPSPQPWMLLAGGTVLVLAMLALRPGAGDIGAGAPARPSGPEISMGRLALILTAGFMAALGMLTTVIGGPHAPLQVRPDPLPGFVVDVQASSRATRTLLISLEGDSYRWAMTSGTRPRWGSGEAYPVLASAEQSDQVAALAAQIAQGTPSDDLTPRLERLAVGHVVLRGASESVVAAVSNAPGLSRAAPDQHTTIWTVRSLISRASLVSDETLTPLPGSVVVRPGQLRIAEPPDQRWVVRLDGEPLPVRADQSGFGLLVDPQGRTGGLAWAIPTPWWSVVLHTVTVLVLGVLAGPTVRRRGARPTYRRLDQPRRAA